MDKWRMMMIAGSIMVATGLMGRLAGGASGPATRTYDMIMLVVGAALLLWGYWRSRE